MTNKKQGQSKNTPVLNCLRSEIFSNLDWGPARLELERRRLLASLEDEGTPENTSPMRRARLSLPIAASVALVFTSLMLLKNGWKEDKALPDKSLVLSRGDVADDSSKISLTEPVQKSMDKLVIEDGSTLWLGQNAQLVFDEQNSNRINLKKGRLLAKIKKVSTGSLRVSTPHVVVVVKGTTFSINVSDEKTIVRLHRGKIELEVGGKTISVRPGREVQVSGQGVIGARPVSSDGVLSDLMIPRQSLEPRRDDRKPALETARPVAGLRELAMEQIIVAERAQPDSGLPKENLSKGEPSTDEIPIGLVEGGTALGRARYSRIRALVKSAKYKDALGAAKNYLRRHPEGIHVEDVLYLKAHCEARVGNLESSRELLESYLNTFPKGRYWERVRDILGD